MKPIANESHFIKVFLVGQSWLKFKNKNYTIIISEKHLLGD